MVETSQGAWLARWLGAAALYFMLAASTIALTSDGQTIATVWPANAVLVALLLSYPTPPWFAVLSAGLIGNLGANWLTRGSVSGPLLYSFANGIEVVATVLLIKTRLGAFDVLRSSSILFRFIFAAGIVAPFFSSLVGASTAWIVYDQSFTTSFITWFFSDSLGLLVFTPVFRGIFSGQVAGFLADKTVVERVKAFGLCALVAAISYVVFYVAAFPALFLLYAPVMLVTFRVGPFGTKMAVMIIAITGTFATASGHGPVVMETADPVTQAHLFQAFLAVMLLTCLPVAAGISERNRLAQELEKRAAAADAEANMDTLTGLLNRRGLERKVSMLPASDLPTFCCVAIDLDRFKAINDQWGHQFGDKVLKHIASTLLANTRSGDLVGRFGGDEFMMILQNLPEDYGKDVCLRIQNALRQRPIAADEKTRIMASISCGIAQFKAGDRLEDVAARADKALYLAKNEGRNRYRSAS